MLHTNDRAVWEWLNSFSEFSPCLMAPIANYRGELYNLPFNMNTFHQLWGVTTPAEAMAKIAEQRVPCERPRSLEEHVLDMVGRDVYERLVKGYTEKQYGKPCSELPASLISRMPMTFEWTTNYNGKVYQGVPADGYGPMFEAMLDGAEVRLGVDFFKERGTLSRLAREVVFSGTVDEYFGYRLGALEWRGRSFTEETRDAGEGQGAPVINYQDPGQPALRSVEHALFLPAPLRPKLGKTVVTCEYATPWEPGDEPFYTVNDKANQARYAQYARLAEGEDGVHFGGRLGEYRYYTMEDTVRSAWRLCDRLFGRIGTHEPRRSVRPASRP